MHKSAGFLLDGDRFIVMPKNFEKAACTNKQLIDQWESRGLLVPDRNKAERYLSHISYYRFSAYTIPFQVPNHATHHFKKNVSFEDILNLYVFDRELRLLVLDAIERIEVSVRAQICNHTSLLYSDPFWYIHSENFLDKYKHHNLLAMLDNKIKQESDKLEKEKYRLSRQNLSEEKETELIKRFAKDNFLRHYVYKEYTPKFPPSWMMVELLTLGELSYLYSCLKDNKLKKDIAQEIGINSALLSSWLTTFKDIRNICAHHGRLWNREFGHALQIPKSSNINWLQQSNSISPNIRYQRRIYSALVAIQCILYEISPYSEWANRLHNLLLKYPNTSKFNMGIPENWQSDNFWSNALVKN